VNSGCIHSARHHDLPGTDEFDHFLPFEEVDHRVELVAPTIDTQDQAVVIVVDDFRVEMFGDVQNFASALAVATNLDQRDFRFKAIRERVIDRMYDVDELRQLLDHLLKDIRVAGACRRDSREAMLRARADYEAFDIVATA